MVGSVQLGQPDLLERVLGQVDGDPGPAALPADCLRWVERIPSRPGVTAPWPEWTSPELEAGWRTQGVAQPWSHQVEAAELAHAGHHVVLATGTASGKSLAYQLPILTALRADPRATALYLSPTKALAADQFRALSQLPVSGVRPAILDGDTRPADRDWVREHARWVLTNPDLLHHSLLPGHPRWRRLLAGLRFVVLDECHSYRGVFGSHVALVIRRLRRLAALYGSDPVFVLASATNGDPAGSARQLTGLPVRAVTEDGSPRAGADFVLWEPPVISQDTGERGAAVRRTATAESARLLARLVAERARTLTFVRSRHAAEQVALTARRLLNDTHPELADRIAAYRGGYLAEERRGLEAALAGGELLGLATTNALELGVDISGLDAAVLAGYPGSLSSVWQQAGRAGRATRRALVVFIARADPLDSYLVHHPRAVFDGTPEAPVIEPGNPRLLAGHLRCAAAEHHLRESDLALFGGPAVAGPVISDLVQTHELRFRPTGWYHPTREHPAGTVDLRGSGGGQVVIVEADTGRLLGTCDSVRAPAAMHPGAVHLHRGTSYLVDGLDLESGVAWVHQERPDWTTLARVESDVHLPATASAREFGAAALDLPDPWRGAASPEIDPDPHPSPDPRQAPAPGYPGAAIDGSDDPSGLALPAGWSAATSWAMADVVERQLPDGVGIGVGPAVVRSQVVGYLRRRPTGELLDVRPLQLPEQNLHTRAVWFTVDPDVAQAQGLTGSHLAGALHAAEHAAIGLLPLFAGCDRGDVGGLSTVLHPDTGAPTVIVHDGLPGGAGFADRGYQVLPRWLAATRDAVRACECSTGCPSCVQSASCGSGNSPLDKSGAVVILDLVLAALSAS